MRILSHFHGGAVIGIQHFWIKWNVSGQRIKKIFNLNWCPWHHCVVSSFWIMHDEKMWMVGWCVFAYLQAFVCSRGTYLHKLMLSSHPTHTATNCLPPDKQIKERSNVSFLLLVVVQQCRCINIFTSTQHVKYITSLRQHFHYDDLCCITINQPSPQKLSQIQHFCHLIILHLTNNDNTPSAIFSSHLSFCWQIPTLPCQFCP